MNSMKAGFLFALMAVMMLLPMLAHASPEPGQVASASSLAAEVPRDRAPRNAERERQALMELVSKIRRADYEGDLEALANLYQELDPFAESPELASRVRYWRGFAVWRRALNAMNEPEPEMATIIRDLELAVEEFEYAYDEDRDFADARIGAAACLMSLGFFAREDEERFSAIADQFIPLMREAYEAEPENPRVLWVVGGNRWWAASEYGGSQAKGIALYEQGLAAARRQREQTNDPLDPSWGEPEILMSLAWSHLNGNTPDLDAAEQYARAALELVPYWHYVRDILLPQILEAKAKQKSH